MRPDDVAHAGRPVGQPAIVGQPARFPHAARSKVVAATLVAVLAVTAVTFAMATVLRAPESDHGTLRGFQIRVLSISQAAAENRFDGALAALHALDADVDAAARDGRISAPRLRGIETALESVRADIDGRLAAQAALAGAAAAPTAVQTPQAESSATQTQDVQPAVEPPASDPQPVPAAQPAGVPGPAKDNNKGKGKNQGKP